MRSGRCVRMALAVPALLVAACLSSAPPAPAVRYFDPLPPAAPAAGGVAPASGFDVRVTAAPHLNREFVVRVAEREVAIDGQNSWFAEPRLLVAAALARRIDAGGGTGGRQLVAIEVAAFELDVVGEPRARIRLVVRAAGPVRVVESAAPAADRSPAAFAAAMAVALERAVAEVASLVAGEPAARGG